MGTLSIKSANSIEVISGRVVDGEVLSDLEFALAGMPVTDDLLVPPQPKGLEPYIGLSQWPLKCSICGEWAGNLLLDYSMSEADQEAAAMATPNRLCPRHHNDSRWERLPSQRNHRGI